MSEPITPESVAVVSRKLATPLVMQFADLVDSHGAKFASIAIFDTCQIALSAALMPLNEPSRREALELLLEAVLEAAEDNDASFANFLHDRRMEDRA